ncbi:MAG: RagB/SusD family nutrient uptake outer membrane protein [Ginsengibacter sp.]
MKHIYKIGLAIFSMSLLVSCHKDLERMPTNGQTSDIIYSTAKGYKLAFAKVYGSFAMTGNDGPGSGDIQGIDPGTSDFLRLYWGAQELSTDEALVAWGDAGIQDFHNMNWYSSNPFLTGLYYRSLYQITLANDFIRNASDANLNARGIASTDAEAIHKYKTEARFLRAYQYSILMDLFGNPHFITDEEAIGSLPKQIKRKDLFDYVEKELKAIEGELLPAKTNQYGRADQAAAWALLTRIYLNAEVFTGTPRYTDAITYSKKVINAGYKLIPDYRQLFLADNHLNTDEFILTINYDGIKTEGYGGTTFITHASTGGSMNAADYGLNSGWGGIRATRKLPDLFPDITGNQDKRAQFYTNGQNMEIDKVSEFTDGVAVIKFRNKTRSGANGQSLEFSDIDYPIFRLGEIYLLYAEAVVRRGTGGDMATAISYINKLRQRAYGNNSGDVSSINLDFILDERARELYWEGYRRTDLIRFGKFTTSAYLWPWKGGVKSGTSVGAYRNLYPLPSKDLSSNPNLNQHANY